MLLFFSSFAILFTWTHVKGRAHFIGTEKEGEGPRN